MRPGVGAAAIWALAAAGALGQVTVVSVVDAASYGPRVAPGSLATVFGSSMAGAAEQATSYPLPTTLGGTSVFINGARVPLLYVSAAQINFQVPSGLAAGTQTLTVLNGRGTSVDFPFRVTPTAPGIFQDTSNNAAVQDGTTYKAITSKNPAAAGATVIVYLTGIGAVDQTVADGTASPGKPAAKATAVAAATVGGVTATVEFLGLAPGFAGLGQANITVPKTLATGTYPVVLNIGGLVSASAQMAVSGTGTAPAPVLSLQGRVAFPNSLTSSVTAMSTLGFTSSGDTVAYVCGTALIQVVDLTTMTYLGAMGVNAQLNNTSGVPALGGVCALSSASGTPLLVEALQVPGGSAAGGYYAVYSVSSPASPVLASGPVSLQQSLTGTVLQNISSLSFLGPYSVSSTNWFAYDSGLNIAAQYGDLFTFNFSSPQFPSLLSVLTPTSALYPGASDLTPKPNALVVPQNQAYNPVAAYVTGSNSTGTQTSGSNGLLTIVDLQNIGTPTPVNQLVSSLASIFTGFGYQYAIVNQPNLVLILGNTLNRRNPGITDPATGAANFAYAGRMTLTLAVVPNSTGTSVDFENLQALGTTVTDIRTNGTYYAQGLGGSFFAIVTQPPPTDLNGPATLMIVDARSVGSPVVYPVSTQFGLSSILVLTSATGEFLLAPTRNGLRVYQVTLP